MRLFLLYSEPSSYLSACLKCLRENYCWEISAICWRKSEDAPFDESILKEWGDVRARTEFDTWEEILDHVRGFDPSVVFVSGWADKSYLKVARSLRKQGLLVVSGLDTQYSGSLRQRVGILLSPWILRSAFDALWVAGERQQQFAWRLGFRGRRCWNGLYCCDWEQFGSQDLSRRKPKHFIFVGRYIDAKGIRLLLSAYEDYRDKNKDPWGLRMIGSGVLKNLLLPRSGVTDIGFVQPQALPKLMHENDVLVLPSLREAWGVVVQEAAAAGLPVICSDAVGASVHLVQNDYNGFVFESGNKGELVDCMTAISSMSYSDFALMRERSRELSRQFKPERWAQTLVNGVASFS